MTTKSLKYFLVLATYSFILISSEAEHEKAKPELGLKYILSWPIEKPPSHGGAVAIEYALAKYFSLAGELGIRWIHFTVAEFTGKTHDEKALDISVTVIPKVIIPVVLENATLVPYVGLPLGISPVNLVNGKNSQGFGFGLIVGMKYYFTENWGANFDFGAQADFRSAQPPYILGGLRPSLGLLYSF
ncbi:MAG TPA: hypothetical protein VEL47_08355 [Myxococcota bacterium]|nr:hypothetical protein [Myxococcota bacterium]